jgi:hypothetical protein
MECADPRPNVYQFGSLGSPQNRKLFKINNLQIVLLKCGSLWITCIKGSELSGFCLCSDGFETHCYN